MAGCSGFHDLLMGFCSGGIGYAGSTACASGKCTYYNDYYSQVSTSCRGASCMGCDADCWGCSVSRAEEVVVDGSG